MSKASPSDIGAVRSLWRYPVKSMMGEALSLTQVTVHGFLGDRIYAIPDSTDGKVARAAKNPKYMARIFFAFQASLQEPEGEDKGTVSHVRITLPDGRIVSSEQHDLTQVLSKALNCAVTLAVTDGGRVTGVQSSMAASWSARSEGYWPDNRGQGAPGHCHRFRASSRHIFRQRHGPSSHD